MVSLGNICDIAAGYGSICEYLMYCGTLREFLRKLGRVRKRPFGSPTSPTFVCARARSKQGFEQARTLVCDYARKSTSWTSTSWTLASIPAPNEPKTCRFCLISSLSTRRGGVWGCAMGVWLVLVVVVIGWGEVGLWWCCVVSNPVNGVVG